MSRDELADNLGTIARSGTQGFMSQLSGDAAKDVQLIGQFGVGFYSAFMVADRGRGASRARPARSTAGAGAPTAAAASRSRRWPSRAPRGTAVILKLRDDAKEFLDEYPPAPDRAQLLRPHRGADPAAGRGQGGPDRRGRTEAKEPEQINQASALWTRPKAEITDEQYKEFYHHVAHAFDDPWARLHVQAEGVVSYQALLFVPGTPPFDLYDPQRQHGVKLYVRRVFITDDLEGLMPRYLRFVSGVVDSEDLQLNVSRETLQHSAVLARIRQGPGQAHARRARPPRQGRGRRLRNFWEQLRRGAQGGHVRGPRAARAPARAGPLPQHRERRLGRPRRLRRPHEAGPGRDLHDQRRAPGGAARSSPQLEACRAKGVEVLLLADPIDEFWLPAVPDYQGKPFRSLTRGDVDLSKIEGAEAHDGEARGEASGRGRRARPPDRGLQGAARRARCRTCGRRPRLTESAVCLVADEHGMDLRLERFLKQHQQLDELSKRVLEINPKHALIRQMARAAADDGQQEALGDLAELLLDQARIVEGEPLPDPGAFSRRMSAFLTKGLAALAAAAARPRSSRASLASARPWR